MQKGAIYLQLMSVSACQDTKSPITVFPQKRPTEIFYGLPMPESSKRGYLVLLKFAKFASLRNLNHNLWVQG